MKTIYTKDKFRLIQTKKRALCEAELNWLFAPGGPGFGSEYFEPYLNQLPLPGNIWRLDFYGDGSNIAREDIDFSSHWHSGLINAVKEIPNVVLVTHSFSGMFALTIPDLEDLLKGLVLMGCAPNKDWATTLPKRIEQFLLPDITAQKEHFFNNQTDENFKDYSLASWPYLISPSHKEQGIDFLSKLPYNCKPFIWAQKQFHPNYEAKWAPQKLPTLIFAGSDDRVTPIELFKNDPHFQRNNIQISVIPNASHFPWIEQPVQVKNLLSTFND